MSEEHKVCVSTTCTQIVLIIRKECKDGKLAAEIVDTFDWNLASDWNPATFMNTLRKEEGSKTKVGKLVQRWRAYRDTVTF
jgi:hypothetical protein